MADFHDPTHPDFRKGAKLAQYFKTTSKDSSKHYLKKLDAEIKSASATNKKVSKSLDSDAVEKSKVAREGMGKATSHLEMLQRIKAGMLSVIKECKSEQDLIAESIETFD